MDRAAQLQLFARLDDDNVLWIMNCDQVKSWLARQIARQILIRWMFALLGLALTPLALLLSAMLIMMFCVILTAGWGGDVLCFPATLVILVLLFVINHYASRHKEPEKYY